MDDFYLFANCNFVPDKYPDWQSAYDSLATYVHASEPTTKSYCTSTHQTPLIK